MCGEIRAYTLPAALELAFGDEGGYSNVKTDRRRPEQVRHHDTTLAARRGVKSLTTEQVMSREEVAGRSVAAICCRRARFAVFDFGANSGPARAVKTLQRLSASARRDLPARKRSPPCESTPAGSAPSSAILLSGHALRTLSDHRQGQRARLED